MPRLPQFALTLFLALMFAACSAAPSNSNATESVSRSAAVNPNQPSAQTISFAQAEQSQNAPNAAERKIIRNAELTLETAVTDDAQRKITSIAEAKNGFVVDTSQEKGGFAVSNKTVQMTIRVPAAQFDATLSEIRAVAARVTAEKISGQDVTDKFVDLEARLQTKKALEAQFFDILKSARTVSETLEIQQKLGDVRSEIEQLQGQLRLLQNQSSLSTVKVTLETPLSFGSSLGNFFVNLGDTVVYGFNAALYLIVGLIWLILALSPLAILIGVPLWLWRRSSRKKREREDLAQRLAREEK